MFIASELVDIVHSYTVAAVAVDADISMLLMPTIPWLPLLVLVLVLMLNSSIHFDECTHNMI